MKVGVIVGSTRPHRVAPAVAQWVYELALNGGDAVQEIVDIADYALPLLEEPTPPSLGRYAHDHTKQWGAKNASLDGFIVCRRKRFEIGCWHRRHQRRRR